jgi:hypothetical protein
MAKDKKTKPHYVDNELFLKAMDEYKKVLTEAEESGEDKPIVPDYIGECIMKIATKLSYSPNFINYSYREDMVLDGIENCIRYIHNFDSEKSKNPFSYFTQIIYFAFLRRIKKEKDQSVIKGKLIREMPYELFELQGHDEDGNFANNYIEFMQTHGKFAEEVEKPPKQKKNKILPSLDDFLED